MEVWHFWAVGALLLFVLEVFTSGFVLACLGVAAVGGALAAALGVGLAGQTVAAALLGAIAFFALRPLAGSWVRAASQAVSKPSSASRSP